MSKMLQHLIFFLLIKQMFSIPGYESFEQSARNFFNKVDISETCPCDTAKNSCEKGCCCDKDCLNFMLDDSFFDDNFECDPESSSSRRIKSKLEYCEDYKKSIDDLYNPLVLAFKILKRGFCLFKDNSKQKEEGNNSQDQAEQNEEDVNLDEYNDENYIKVPLALPSGMCLFNSYPIKKFIQDYEVTCTYKNNLNYMTFVENIIDQSIDRANSNESIYHLFSNNEKGNKLKKLEIFYLSETKNYEINYYLEYKNNINVPQDFTFVIKNFQNEKDFHKSGNPGYIKGKPILIGQRDEENKRIKKFRNDIVFPVSEVYKCINDGENDTNNFFYYYDNYMDNKLTFEDLIFYQYTNQTTPFTDLINDFKNIASNFYFGNFGNANLKYDKDWQKMTIDFKNEEENLLLLGVYMDYGLVNNTQFKIQDFEIQGRNFQGNEKNYFIMKFLKKNDTEDGWWYSPGPGFIIRVPKNWMYPFQIGTTTYRTKN